MLVNYSKFIIAFFVLMGSMFGYAESSLDTEKKQIKEYMSGNAAQIKKGIDLLEWTGISDPTIFDPMMERLKSNFMDSSKMGIETNAWLAKGIALSGNVQYKAELEAIFQSEAHKKLRKHVRTAIVRLDQFTVWNPIISANNSSAKNQTELDDIRLMNMLNSRRGDLLGTATRKIYFNYVSNTKYTDLISEELRSNYLTASTDDEVDAYSWMCRTLAETGNKAYKPILDEVASNPKTHKKLAKYATKYAGYLL
jgi:hypothetical protein